MKPPPAPRAMSGTSALQQFLRQASCLKADAEQQQQQQRVVVLGNEAGDLDSVAASIALSFLLAASNDATAPSMFAGTCTSSLSVAPVLNFKREDMALRKDVSFVLSKAGIDVSYVLFIDDLPLQQLADKRLLQLVLVDHNELCPAQSFAAPHVIACIDHHADVQQDASPRRCIRTVGSCCSIIVDLFSQQPSLLSAVAFLLAAAITVDTKNLTSPVTTDSDRSAMRFLRPLLDAFDDAAACDLFANVQGLRLDVSGLTVPQLFLKDMKQFLLPCGVTITFSSLPVPISKLSIIEKSWTSSVLDLILARGWHVLVALGSVDASSGLRSVAILARNDAAAALVLSPFPHPHFLLLTPHASPVPSAALSHRNAIRGQNRHTRRHLAHSVRRAMGGQNFTTERSRCQQKVVVSGVQPPHHDHCRARVYCRLKRLPPTPAISPQRCSPLAEGSVCTSHKCAFCTSPHADSHVPQLLQQHLMQCASSDFVGQ